MQGTFDLLPDDKQEHIIELIEDLMNKVNEESLYIIQNIYTHYNQTNLDRDEKVVKIIIEGLWNYFNALKEVHNIGNFQAATQLMHTAKTSFQKVRMDNLSEIAGSLLLYFDAIKEMQDQNISSAIKKMALVKEKLKKAGKFSLTFEPIIDHIEPESFFIAAIKAITTLDFINGEILIEKASEASFELAGKYYEKESIDYNTFYGLGYYYKALYEVITTINEFNEFNFTGKKLSDNESKYLSEKALNHLINSALENINLRYALYVSKIIYLLAMTIESLNNVFKHLISGNSKIIIIFNKENIEEDIETAKKLSIKCDSQGAIILKLVESIEKKLINIDKIITKRKDIVITKEKEFTLQTVKNKAKTLISKNKLKKAFSILWDTSKDPDIIDDLIILQMQMNRTINDQLMQQITKEDANVELNRISLAVLSLIQEI